MRHLADRNATLQSEYRDTGNHFLHAGKNDQNTLDPIQPIQWPHSVSTAFYETSQSVLFKNYVSRCTCHGLHLSVLNKETTYYSPTVEHYHVAENIGNVA